jgi:hypothetical protein
MFSGPPFLMASAKPPELSPEFIAVFIAVFWRESGHRPPWLSPWFSGVFCGVFVYFAEARVLPVPRSCRNRQRSVSPRPYPPARANAVFDAVFRAGPFLSEIRQNPRLFWVSSDETPQPRRSPLGLNKAQHGAAATLPFVGAANHRGPLQMSGFVRLSRYALLLGHRCKR